MSVRFFAFRPRGLRRALVGAAGLAVVLSAWALASGLRGAERLGTLRAVFLAALAVGFTVGWVFLRPRADFGIRLDTAGIDVSRPWGAPPLHIPWTHLGAARTERRLWTRLVLEVRPEGKLLIARPLLGSREAFAELVRALEEGAPKPPGDA
ncbi:MAG: hypothetical protein ACLQDQ_04315 [Myxococcaceae bacterium]